MSLSVSAFKAYDIRGRVPDELNEEIAEAIGRAYASYLEPQRVVVGHDIRLSSPGITGADFGRSATCMSLASANSSLASFSDLVNFSFVCVNSKVRSSIRVSKF